MRGSFTRAGRLRRGGAGAIVRGMNDGLPDVDPDDGRNESVSQRSDRNWDEILQELRVTQTGTQIITGFLLTIAFQQRFTELGSFLTGIYLALVVLAAICTGLGLVPVALHRALFRRHEKAKAVTIADRFVKAAVALVAVLAGGVVLFIFSFVGGTVAGIVAGVAVWIALAVLLLLVPLGSRDRAEHR